MLSALRTREVEVHLPRFRMESSLQLGDVLRDMGMADAFDPEIADFSGMSDQDEVAITEVVHRAFAEVHEEGTEAAASTAAVAVLGCAVDEPSTPVFRADHPFFFLIRDRRSGSTLFMGRLIVPEE